MGTTATTNAPNVNDHNAPSSSSEITSSPWRITLDIGREPLASMPFKWARSGCRMPLVIPCHLRSDRKVIPRSESVSFTGPNGAVTSPIQGGEWEIKNGDTELNLELAFPEYVERRDVWIDAGTVLSLCARTYKKDEIDELDRNFYEAREEAWELGKELNEITKKIEGPKQWNEEKQAWEKRTDGIPSVFSQIQKRIKHAAAQANQKRKADLRPSLNDLSEIGSIPGVSNGVYIQKEGVIKIGNAVAGRWFAEPINK